MSTIIVNKIGTVFRTRAEGSNASGEQGETEGLIRHLVDEGHRVVYVGPVSNRPATERLGVEVYVPDLSHLLKGTSCHLSTSDMQHAGFRSDETRFDEMLGTEDNIMWLQVCGYASTWSIVANEACAQAQACGIQYAAPALNLLRYLCSTGRCRGRVLVNNDPRTYPRDGEMTMSGWDYLIPVGLLDQCSKVSEQRSQGVTFKRKHVYANCESWGYIEPRKQTHETECVVVAHAHIGDRVKKKARDAAWHNVLDGSDYLVYGGGWEHYSGYDEDHARFPGMLKGSQVGDMFARATCSPAVAIDKGFYTGKPYVQIASGCIPLLYGDGRDPHTWDPNGLLVPLDSDTRIREPGHLKYWAQRLHPGGSMYREFLETWQRLLPPNFDVLDRCVDAYLSRADLWEHFGGYRRV